MEWIGVGFLLALGAWLFTVVLRWAQRNPLIVVNAALLALSALILVGTLLAAAYSWWAGIVALLVSSAIWQGVFALRRIIGPPPEESSVPSA
jgi:hypothetical protein